MSRQTKTSFQYMLFLWLFTTILAFMVNCAPEKGRDGTNGTDGESCTVTDFEGGVEIKCGETVAVVYDGPEGPKGEDGQDVCKSIFKRDKKHDNTVK